MSPVNRYPDAPSRQMRSLAAKGRYGYPLASTEVNQRNRATYQIQ